MKNSKKLKKSLRKFLQYLESKYKMKNKNHILPNPIGCPGIYLDVTWLGREKECMRKNKILYIVEDNKELMGGFDGK